MIVIVEVIISVCFLLHLCAWGGDTNHFALQEIDKGNSSQPGAERRFSPGSELRRNINIPGNQE